MAYANGAMYAVGYSPDVDGPSISIALSVTVERFFLISNIHFRAHPAILRAIDSEEALKLF